jgi:CRP/FNR family transcriptional regulator, cyclic AMP receptor protein
MSAASPPRDQVAQLSELARYFAEQRMYAEAADLYALAVQVAPGDAAARRGLDRMRRAQRRVQGSGRSTLREAVQEEFRRSSIDGAHFVGLANLYAHQRRFADAIECLEVAQTKAPANPAHHKLYGTILYRRREFDAAVRELERALLLDPFDRQVAETLGLAYHEWHRFEDAAGATAHAFLLLPDLDTEVADRLRRRLLTLRRILGWSNRELQRLFRRRQEVLHTAFDRLEWHRERFHEEASLPRGGALFGAPPPREKRGLIELAARLRRLRVWSELSDQQLFRLAGAVQEEFHEPGSLIYTQGSPGRDLYAIEQGEVTVQRPTSYGTFRLRVLPPDELLGEAAFLSRQDRSNDALATRPTHLLRLDNRELEALLVETPELGAQLLWSVWHSLARKLRSGNEQLRTIFAGATTGDTSLGARLHPEAKGERVEVDEREKIEVFREQGLSHHELMTLATFSREKRFAEGEYLFHEGDPGDELYAVVEGRALISKFIPGGGDEALAILSRGEFFGEMALIEGRPRSADARAFGGALTVLALDGKTIRDLFTLDAAASLEFLRLLCRLMARRLAEIEDKVIGWRILDGYRQEQATVGSR